MKPQPPWSSARRRRRGGSCPTSCARRPRSTPPSAAWCRRSPRAPMSTCSTASSRRAMKEAGVGFAQLSAVAAAAGPGLIGGVIVGLTTAKAIAMVHDTPLIAVNHLEAHALTPRLTCALAFPYCLFLASGGHTQIVAVIGVGNMCGSAPPSTTPWARPSTRSQRCSALPYPGGPRGRARGARRRPQAICVSAADARTRRRQFLAVGIEDRGAQRGQPARRRWSRRTSAISAPAFRPRCWNRPRTG